MVGWGWFVDGRGRAHEVRTEVLVIGDTGMGRARKQSQGSFVKGDVTYNCDPSKSRLAGTWMSVKMFTLTKCIPCQQIDVFYAPTDIDGTYLECPVRYIWRFFL
jgi:hypothetical protein